MLLASLAAIGCLQSALAAQANLNSVNSGRVPICGFEVIHTYPHDNSAFTQGLAYDGGVLYEGTGKFGQSTLRRVDLKSGRVLQQTRLNGTFFGEGVAVCKDRLVQLTWKSGIGLVYDKQNLTQIGEFRYPTEGWGITSDGERLIMSDGTDTLHFLDPETFEELGQIKVKAAGVPVQGLNELEYIKGEIYANLWPTNWIAIISPQTGEVLRTVNLSGILQRKDARGVDVLNGIAYDPEGDRLFVTGKLWPKLFQIELVTEKKNK
ncbi:MAG: glutaminyl-peptide cyclotransferase [Veillonellaceae bacterium]|nr:glutaminyl-peptide cyclotransferase [Veillonellaceae bacterium]